MTLLNLKTTNFFCLRENIANMKFLKPFKIKFYSRKRFFLRKNIFSKQTIRSLSIKQITWLKFCAHFLFWKTFFRQQLVSKCARRNGMQINYLILNIFKSLALDGTFLPKRHDTNIFWIRCAQHTKLDCLNYFLFVENVLFFVCGKNHRNCFLNQNILNELVETTLDKIR